MAAAELTPTTLPAPFSPKDEPHEEPPARDLPEDDLVESELLVEDVSIDGMCGVY